MNAFDRAIEAAGGVSALAKKLGVKQPRVSNWRTRGVPAEFAIPIERAVEGAVTRAEISPRMYPPSDEAAA
jgi:DNA-binding transcriptional regulator YdaS (Cro superfamily)